MRRWIVWATVVLVAVVVCAGGLVLLQRTACRAATKNGTVKDFHEVTSEELDREVRNRVLLGSPRAYVEGFLSREQMQFSYDPLQHAIFANAPCTKGSGVVIKSLGFTFRFDIDSKLTSIESNVHLTGP